MGTCVVLKNNYIRLITISCEKKSLHTLFCLLYSLIFLIHVYASLRRSYTSMYMNRICSAFDQTLWNQNLSDLCLQLFLLHSFFFRILLKLIQFWLATCISNLYRFAICMCKVLIQEIAFVAVYCCCCVFSFFLSLSPSLFLFFVAILLYLQQTIFFLSAWFRIISKLYWDWIREWEYALRINPFQMRFISMNAIFNVWNQEKFFSQWKHLCMWYKYSDRGDCAHSINNYSVY